MWKKFLSHGQKKVQANLKLLSIATWFLFFRSLVHTRTCVPSFGLVAKNTEHESWLYLVELVELYEFWEKIEIPHLPSIDFRCPSHHINSHVISTHSIIRSTHPQSLNSSPWTRSVSTVYSCAPWSSLLFIKAMQLHLVTNHLSLVCFHSHLLDVTVVLSMSRYRTTIGTSIFTIGITSETTCPTTM